MVKLSASLVTPVVYSAPYMLRTTAPAVVGLSLRVNVVELSTEAITVVEGIIPSPLTLATTIPSNIPVVEATVICLFVVDKVEDIFSNLLGPH